MKNNRWIMVAALCCMIGTVNAESYVWVSRDLPTIFPVKGQTYTAQMNVATFGGPQVFGVKEILPEGLEVVDVDCGGVVRGNMIEWVFWEQGACNVDTKGLSYTYRVKKDASFGVGVFTGAVMWPFMVEQRSLMAYNGIDGEEAVLIGR
jgi:hypothetical protein